MIVVGARGWQLPNIVMGIGPDAPHGGRTEYVDPSESTIGGDVRAGLQAELVAAIDRHDIDAIVVRGATGAGKTWFVGRLLDRLQRPVPTRRVDLGQRSGGGTSALWSLVAAEQPVPGVRTDGFGIDGLTAAALSEALIEECPDGATVVVEDLHGADRSARAALHLLIERARQHQPAFVFIVTARSDHPETGAALAELERQASVMIADVPPLTEDEVHAIIRSLGFDRVDPQLAHSVLRLSGGNALWVVEALRELVDEGVLRIVAGRATAIGDVAATLPSELRAVLERRLDRLDRSDDLAAVAAVSVLGRDATAAALAELLPPTDSQGERLAAAIDLGMVEQHGDVFACRHQLIGQVATERLGLPQVRRLHARAAEVLAGRSVASATVAAHLVAADSDAPPAMLAQHGLSGVESLVAAGAWAEAGRLGDLIAAAGLESAAVCFATGWAHQGNADSGRAQLAYGRAAELAMASGELDLLVMARCWSARGRAFSDQLRVPATLVQELDETAQLDGVRGVALHQTRLHAAAAEILASAGLVHEALARAEAGLAASGTEGALLATTCSSHGIALLSTLELRRADDLLRRSRRHAKAVDNHNLQIVAGARSAWLAIARGELDEAEDLLGHDDELLVAHGSWADRCLSSAAWCALALARGDLDDLEVQGERARRMVHRSEYYLGPMLVYPTLIAGALATGAHVRAWSLLDEWADTGQPGQSPARMLVRLEEGALSSVTEELRDRPPARRWPGEPNFANVGILSIITELAARTGSAGPGFDRLVNLAERLAASELGLVPTYPSSTHMVLADGLAAMGDRAGAAASYGVAASSAATMGAPLVQARALLGQAANLDVDDPARLASAQAALAIADRLGASAVAARAAGLLSEVDARSIVAADGSTRLALLLTDVVSSTAIADLHGDEVYTDLIDLHDRLIRAELKRFGGQEFEHTGDGIYAWFTDVRSATACGQAIQRVTGRQVAGARLDVRTAVVYGDCYLRRSRPYGGLCNLAARICNLASAGSMVVSDDVRRLLGDTLPLRPLPPRPLKGLATPPQLFEVRHVESTEE